MTQTQVLSFPVDGGCECENDLVVVELRKTGSVRTLKELPREMVVYAKKLAAITGDDWKTFIEPI